MILRARIVLPISNPPIENGAVDIQEGKIRAVGQWDRRFAGSDSVTDLGEVVLFPGFVNAHCHLDYTSMAGKLPSPRSFPDWIKSILSLKAHYSYTDYAASWMLGTRQLLQSGTTTVADVEAVPELLAEVLSATPLKVYSFLEMTGVKSGRSGAEILRETVKVIDSLPPKFAARAGLSPHAPYSTNPDLLKATAEFARSHGAIVSTHVAESKAEWDMFTERRGPLFDWLKNQRDMEDCGGISPVAHLERQGLFKNRFLAVHANYLDPRDCDSLSGQSVSVIHCPRSHAYFNHAPFPYKELRALGANICLGTDSLASVLPGTQTIELSIFEEMRAFAKDHPEVEPAEIISMATAHGAKALGQEADCGKIAEGASADMAAIPFNGGIEVAYSAVLNHAAAVSFSMIDGLCVYPQSSD
ncbi:MAG: Amidohydrolase [Verrucomicrobiales bacterium]|nr:Amidohydrolase [Verrucomicrobiales bacterium]